MNANQLPTPTFYYMHECQDSLIERFTVCVNSNSFTPRCYEQQKRFTYIGTVSESVRIRRPGETRVYNGERPGISTLGLFLPHDQIMVFDWMRTCHVII